MRKWVNTEIGRKEAETFSRVLKEMGVKYEASGCYGNVHFEVYANDDEIRRLNSILDAM